MVKKIKESRANKHKFDKGEDITDIYYKGVTLSPLTAYSAESPFQIVAFTPSVLMMMGAVMAEKAIMAGTIIASKLGISPEQVSFGTKDQLAAKGIDIEEKLTPLGVGPLPRWDAQAFLVFQK